MVRSVKWHELESKSHTRHKKAPWLTNAAISPLAQAKVTARLIQRMVGDVVFEIGMYDLHDIQIVDLGRLVELTGSITQTIFRKHGI
jgi:hypothetical protein